MNEPNATPPLDAGGNPETGSPAPDGGNIQPSGEASGQSATASENFIPKGVDLNTLPPTLRAELDRINKEMVRGFTSKAEALAAKEKLYEGFDGFKQKAELYDQIATQEEFVKQWNDYVQKLQQNGQPAPAIDDELKKEVMELKQKVQQTEALEFINAWATATNEKGEPLRPDFEKLENLQFPDVKAADGSSVNLLNVAVHLAPGRSPEEKLQNGYAVAKKFHDQIFEAGRKSAFGQVQSRIRNGSEPPTVAASSDQVVVKNPKDISARDALRAAREGKRIVVQT